MIKLIHIGEGKRWAGIETHIYLLLEEIKKMGIVKHLSFVSIFEGLLCKKISQINIQTSLLERNGKFSLKPIFKLRSYILENSIEIVHSHGYLASIYGLIAIFLINRKVSSVITFHQRSESHPSFKLNFYVRIMVLFSKWFGSHFICVSEDVKFSALKRFKIPEDRVTIIHNGIPSIGGGVPVNDKKLDLGIIKK
jgi:glycosyltransferase involved in cell wall biosynthesis